MKLCVGRILRRFVPKMLSVTRANLFEIFYRISIISLTRALCFDPLMLNLYSHKLGFGFLDRPEN